MDLDNKRNEELEREFYHVMLEGFVIAMIKGYIRDKNISKFAYTFSQLKDRDSIKYCLDKLNESRVIDKKMMDYFLSGVLSKELIQYLFEIIDEDVREYLFDKKNSGRSI